MELNGIEPAGAEGPRRSFRNHRLRRGIYILPSLLTVGNILCGYYAILATMEGGPLYMDYAARAIGFAFLFDTLDGRIARAMGTNSEFGKEFDSLADVVSFGIAPALLAYAWGVRALAAAASPGYLHLIQLGWLVCFFFVICCAWRLARFNIHGMAPGSNRYFVGLPTPIAAGMVAAVVHAAGGPIENPAISVLWLALVALLGVLMASTVRYYSFKEVQWTRRQPSLAVVALATIGALIVFFSRPTLLILAGVYVAHGIIFYLGRLIRRRMAARRV
ncbi:MAG TPA: CDP-diacylglycerol--serine O-phosphatidyltransferase [Candidatus Acidoferrales bacterium]|nr:CDP-diacylglycerol--serine O-phosphatidyltransferase [Candidatus Acidoferrales bacterium]